MRQILRGFNYLQELYRNQIIIHRDLRLENIFVSKKENGEVVMKIGDFGYAKAIKREGTA